MEPLNEHDELKRSAPKLASLPKADPFVVPDAFFEQFPHQVQARVTAQRSARPWAFGWKLAIALPVVALLSFGLWNVLHHDTPNATTAEVIVTPLTDEELMAYDDMDPMPLVEEAGLPPMGDVVLQLNDEDLLAYLEEEHADLSELITETE